MAGSNHGGELISSGYQGVVYKIDVDSSNLELPEIDSRYLIVKETMGSAMVRKLRRLMLRREYDVYRRLEGIAGIPRCYGLEDGHRLVSRIHRRTFTASFQGRTAGSRCIFFGIAYDDSRRAPGRCRPCRPEAQREHSGHVRGFIPV